MLSSRILHFLDDQIAWECNTTLYMEDDWVRRRNPPDHFGKSHFTEKFHHSRVDKEKEDADDELGFTCRIGAWNAMLQEISVRFFTVRSDKLPSISGLASALQVAGLGKYLAGVWEWNPFLSTA